MKAKHLTILALIACGAIFGVQAVLAAEPHHPKTHHRQRGGHYYDSGFAVLTRGVAKTSDAQPRLLGVPSSAVLAESVPGSNIYVFPLVQHLEAQTCVADEEVADAAGGRACGSTETAEREGLSLIYLNPDGTQTLILLVPNGVKTVLATTRNNGSAAVTVTNNIAVIKGDLTAYHFVAPSGYNVSVPLEG
jgi:hypothetical protein